MTTDGDVPAAMTFELLKSAPPAAAARLGRLALGGRKSVIDTPNYFAITSRGVVPHVSPDNVARHLQTGGAYMALEDFIERPQQNLSRRPPIYDHPSAHGRPLHSFAALPPSLITVLSARRLPAVPAPLGNSNRSVSIFTSTGFQVLTTKDYLAAVQALRPDIAIPLADLTHKELTPTSKRALRMTERTDDWVREWFADQPDAGPSPDPNPIATFAPVLPVSYSLQWEYLERLSEDLISRLSGLAIYDADILPDLTSSTSYANLAALPRLSVAAPPSPHHVLRQISLGMDLFTLPFLNAVSDAGIALTFTFPSPSPTASADAPAVLPLGIDMSSTEHQTSLAPLAPGCTCYTCTHHHRAYVQHLLSAREMLGWTLLQLHNHAVVAAFFAGVRQTLAQEDGVAAFEHARARFHAVYDPELPAGTGERPRARGYHFKSQGGEGKRNKPGWSKLDEAGAEAEAKAAGARAEDVAAAAAAGAPDADVADALQRLLVSGGIDTPVSPPDADADELCHKGFAEVDKQQ
ncbi:tRNA-guanine(15) transglycosylase-like protein [Podospora appendiculata]|uniref:Queuine tRNA-ribosyltransferase accessory subunit 2 n=1 Tax=Podospora appendiculata TaxID=314037 RepID=A0AAE1CAD4_9PEZI|nr:tRNA-guanine(15) transglycosylase-like protein [Podospora appendiculata]